MQKLIKTTKSKISGGLYVTSFYNMYVQNLKYNIKGTSVFVNGQNCDESYLLTVP